MIRRYLLSGRVQGVGFRWFVRQEATRLGLRGMVRNLPDGRVEVIAAGHEPEIESFVALLRRGPPGSRVTGLEITPPPGEQELPEGFRIGR